MFFSNIIILSLNWVQIESIFHSFYNKNLKNQNKNDVHAKLKSWAQKRGKVEPQDQVQKLKTLRGNRDLFMRMWKSIFEFPSTLSSC